MQLLHQRASCRRRNEEETCCPLTVAICYCFSLVLFAFWPTDKQASGRGEGRGAARAECQEERSKTITWQRDRRPCYLTLDTQLLAGVRCSYQCYDRFLFLTKLSSKTFWLPLPPFLLPWLCKYLSGKPCMSWVSLPLLFIFCFCSLLLFVGPQQKWLNKAMLRAEGCDKIWLYCILINCENL